MPQVKKECTIEKVREMLIEMVKEHECPLCGAIIYGKIFSSERERFLYKHLPFIEDTGDAIVAGIICGNKGAQRITLLRCVKEGGEVSDRTEIY